MHRSTLLALAFAVAADASIILPKRDPHAPDSETAITITSTAPTPDLTTQILTSVVSIEQPGSTVIVTEFRTASASNPSKTPTSPTPYLHDSSNSNSSSSFETVDPAARACTPTDPTTNRLDFSAPCNLVAAIEVQCSYGHKALESLSNNPSSSNSPKSQPLSPTAERTCICQSQILDATLGCWACFDAHEPPSSPSSSATFSHDELETFLHSMMGRYCDVGFTPKQSFLEFYYEAEWDAFGWGGSEVGEEDEASSFSSISSSPTYTYASGPIGTSTDVSLYYTMSVTRSDAYDLAVPTGSNGNVTYTSTRTSDGQIVPTAVDAKESGPGSSRVSASGSGGNDAASSTSASTTSSADSGAAATAYAGAAGLFAVVALVGVGL